MKLNKLLSLALIGVLSCGVADNENLELANEVINSITVAFKRK